MVVAVVVIVESYYWQYNEESLSNLEEKAVAHKGQDNKLLYNKDQTRLSTSIVLLWQSNVKLLNFFKGKMIAILFRI